MQTEQEWKKERERESDESSAHLSVVPEQCTKAEGSGDVEKAEREKQDEEERSAFAMKNDPGSRSEK